MAEEKKKTRACTECHRSKNKCVYDPENSQQQGGGQRPRCERCIRLDKVCIPHLSRQGKRKNRLTVDSVVVAAGGGGGGGNASASAVAAPPGGGGATMGIGNSGMPNNGRSRRSTVDSNSGISMLSNQAQILDMVETDNLQQLSNSLNLNNFAGSGGGGSSMTQQQVAGQGVGQQVGQITMQSNNPLQGLADSILQNSNTTSAQGQQALNLLSRAMNEGGMGNSANNLLGGGNMTGTGSGGSTIDQAKLNLMISQLTSNQNNTGGSNSALGNQQQLNNMGNFNPNLGGSGNNSSMAMVSTSQQPSQSIQPSAAALMMLAGHASTGAGGSIPTSLNNLNVTKKFGNKRSATIMSTPTASNNAANQVYSGATSSSSLEVAQEQAVGRRGSMPLGIGGGNSMNTNNSNNNMNNASMSNQGGIGGNSNLSNQGIVGNNSTYSSSNNNNQIGVGSGSGSGSISESLLKKQKKAHLLPNAPNAPVPAPHVPYPPISLIPNKDDNNAGRGSGNKNKNSTNDKDCNGKNSTTDNNKGDRHPQHHRSSSIDSNTDSNNNALSRSSSTANFLTPEDAIGNHIARACAKHSGQKLPSLKNHYGLQCQIREWISMALTRRSFALLSKASSLANRCGIHMDRILCGVAENIDDDNGGEQQRESSCGIVDNMGGRMNYLLATLLEPRSQQTIPVEERHMLIPRLPKEFLNVVGCQNCPSFQKSQLRNRWIIIRETYRGGTRFFTSPAFERNVLCWAHISQIYEDNLADINSLIFVKEDFRKFLACNAHQISLHSTPGMPPRPVHAPKTKIRLLGRQWGRPPSASGGGSGSGSKKGGKITKEMITQVQDGSAMTLEMDLRFVSFPSMDKMTYYLEFFHHSKDGNSSTGTGNSWTRNLSDTSLDKSAAHALMHQQQSQHQQPQSSSVSFSNNVAASRTANNDRIVSESPGSREEPPMFDDIIDSEEWVGIDDVLASGDIDNLLNALLD